MKTALNMLRFSLISSGQVGQHAPPSDIGFSHIGGAQSGIIQILDPSTQKQFTHGSGIHSSPSL